MYRQSLAALFSCALAGTAHGADEVIALPDQGGFFGSISGSYILKDPNDDWQFIGFPAQEYSWAGLGDGYRGDAKLGYRWSEWDAAIGLSYARLSTGDASVSPWVPALNEGSLKGTLFAVDAELGYNTTMGNHSVRAAGGIRYAQWDNTVETFWPGAVIPANGPVYHDFWGVGPVVKLNGSVPAGGTSGTIEYGLSASVLFGDLETYTNNPAYNCSGCSDRSNTAFSVGGDVGYGFSLAEGVRATVGWQLEYWGNVNVEVTDLDFGGTDAGTSGHLLTGPFLRVNF